MHQQEISDGRLCAQLIGAFGERQGMRRILLAAGVAFALAISAVTQCHPPHFRKGRDFIDAGTGRGALYVSIRPSDFGVSQLICLAETLRSQHPNWRDISVLVFSSPHAAYDFQASYADYEDPVAWAKWARQLHASYFFNAEKREEYLEILPLGYKGPPSNNSRIDLPLVAAPHCRLELSARCVIALDGIDYPPGALQSATSGSITLQGTIARGGRVHGVHLVQSDVNLREGESLLVNAAIQNLSTWRVDPAPREDAIRVIYSYVIASPGEQADVQFELPNQVVIRARRPE
jgi:Gram-negative bacterial TonB protein C-terminal